VAADLGVGLAAVALVVYVADRFIAARRWRRLLDGVDRVADLLGLADDLEAPAPLRPPRPPRG
jgi:hypothetical protein